MQAWTLPTATSRSLTVDPLPVPTALYCVPHDLDLAVLGSRYFVCYLGILYSSLRLTSADQTAALLQQHQPGCSYLAAITKDKGRHLPLTAATNLTSPIVARVCETTAAYVPGNRAGSTLLILWCLLVALCLWALELRRTATSCTAYAGGLCTKNKHRRSQLTAAASIWV